MAGFGAERLSTLARLPLSQPVHWQAVARQLHGYLIKGAVKRDQYEDGIRSCCIFVSACIEGAG